MVVSSTKYLTANSFPLTRLFASIVAVLILTAFLYGALLFLDRDALPISSVFIEGDLKYIDVTDIKTKVEKSIDAGLFYVDIRRIKKELHLEPWVKDVVVRKVWPPGLVVKIIERKPIARWGDELILSSEGAVFEPPSMVKFKGLVMLFSPLESPKKVVTEFLVLKRKLGASGINIRTLKMSDRREWIVITTDNKIINFGRGNLNLNLSRFQYAYDNKINLYWPHITTVDLRYFNGVAVRKIIPQQSKEDRPDG